MSKTELSNFDMRVSDRVDFIRSHQPPQRPLSDDEIEAMAKTDIQYEEMLSELTENQRSYLKSFLLRLDLKVMVGDVWPGEVVDLEMFLPGIFRQKHKMEQIVPFLLSERFGTTKSVVLSWIPDKDEFRLERNYTLANPR